jgi:hypothetical protein
LDTTLEAEFVLKYEDLKAREGALAERQKALDNRDNTHARRQKQEDLNKILQSFHASFKLTLDTAKKRWPVHGAFIAGLTVLAGLIGINTWHSFQVVAAGDTQPYWWYPLRLSVFTVGFIGLLVYYIRWQDNWAQSHADEEFRLKRLELDGVRASWLVEVLLEWQREGKAEIPSELIERLGAGLFEVSAPRAGATHPVEDAIARVLGSSPSVQLDFPGGKVSLDKKSIDRAKASGA